MSSLHSMFLMAAEYGMAIAYRMIDSVMPYDATCACFISYPDIADNSYAMFAYLTSAQASLEAPKKVIWLVSDVPSAKNRLANLAESVKLGASTCKMVKKNSLLGLFVFIRSGTVFFTHGHYRFVRSTKKSRKASKLVNLWHGMPIKVIGYLDPQFKGRVQASDVIVSSSKSFSVIMASAFRLPEDRVVVAGLPRVDFLYQSRRIIRRRIGVAEKQRLLLWMPTYRISDMGDVRNDGMLTAYENDEEFRQDLCFLNKVVGEVGGHVCVKFHPMDALRHGLYSGFDNISFIRSDDEIFTLFPLYAFISICDLVITDVSSVAVDLIDAAKPVAITEWKVDGYARGIIRASFDFMLSHAHVLREWSDLSSLLKDCKYGVNYASDVPHMRNSQLVFSRLKNLDG